MATYCEGTRCKKKDTCKHHCDIQEGILYEYIDYSVQGSCSYTDGKIEVEHWCGDDSGDYPRSKPMKVIIHKRPDKKNDEESPKQNDDALKRCPICNNEIELLVDTITYSKIYTCDKCGFICAI